MHTQRGVSIFGFITLVALTAAIVWSTLHMIQRPLPKESLAQKIKALQPSPTVPAMTAPLELPEATTSTTTASSTITATSTATSTKTATTTKKTTTKKP